MFYKLLTTKSTACYINYIIMYRFIDSCLHTSGEPKVNQSTTGNYLLNFIILKLSVDTYKSRVCIKTIVRNQNLMSED